VPRVDAPTVIQHRRQLLAKIFGSFDAMVAARGYDAVTLAGVAQGAGLARTAMYHYFPDKEALLVASTEHTLDEHLSELRAGLERGHGGLDKLDRFVDIRIGLLTRHPAPTGPGLERVLSAGGYEAVRRYEVVIDEILAAILEEAVDEGEVPPSVRGDVVTVALVQACIASAASAVHGGGPRQRVVDSTRSFVRRAVGASSADR
jgi:AcrR family transcriptional regulator